MTAFIPEHPDEITPAWLTGALLQRQTLVDGKVLSSGFEILGEEMMEAWIERTLNLLASVPLDRVLTQSSSTTPQRRSSTRRSWQSFSMNFIPIPRCAVL